MKKRMKVAALMLAGALTVTTAFVPTSAAKKVNVKKVTVESSISGDKKTVYVAKGKSVKLSTTVTVTPNKKANKKVKYAVKNKKIATVSKKGVIKGKKAGTTKVTVTSLKNKKKKATITVKVTKNPVKSVKLDKKTDNLKLGDSVTLKATVKAGKGAYKKVAWKSSKKKVATVTKKGVVKAVGVGSAVITASAVDGSGKKAKYTVTVTNPIDLANMEVVNAQTVNFSLSTAYALTADQISLMTKENAEGEYKKALKITSFTTTDNVNYSAVLDNDTRIYYDDYVQLSVPSLSGSVKVMEKQYKEQVCAFTEDVVSSWKLGKYGSQYFGFSDKDGYSEYAISGLPAGLTSEIKSGSCYVKGIPTQTGTFQATLTAKDECGNALTKNIVFIIGSDDVVAAAVAPKYGLVGGESVNFYNEIKTVGGKGDLKYEIIQNPQNLPVKLYGEDITATIANAGDYTVKVRVTDEAGHYADCDVVYHIAAGITVTGLFKDAQGNVMNEGSVSFDNKNRADRYATYRSASVDESKGNTYSVLLSPGTYDVYAYYDGCDELDYDPVQAKTYLYDQQFTATRSGYDFSLPLYKVSFTTKDNLNYPSWTIDGVSVGYGSSFYIKPGNYKVESSTMTDYTDSEQTSYSYFSGGKAKVSSAKVKYTADLSVVNAGVTLEPKKEQVSAAVYSSYSGYKDTTYSISLDTEAQFKTTLADNTKYANKYYGSYKFVPSETGEYVVTSLEDEDGDSVTVKVYDENGTVLYTSSNKAYKLEKGKTYYIANTSYDADDSDDNDYIYGSVKITKYSASTTEGPIATTQEATSTTQEAAATTQSN